MALGVGAPEAMDDSRAIWINFQASSPVASTTPAAWASEAMFADLVFTEGCHSTLQIAMNAICNSTRVSATINPASMLLSR
jgi:hypothetical protein